jgi:hypothetical protein
VNFPRLYSVRFWAWLDRLLADPDPYAEHFGDHVPLLTRQGNQAMTEFIECKSYSTAKRLAPWAAVISKVCGGFIAYEFMTDYATARRQK